MSSKSIKVVCEEKCLNIIYSPAINFDVIEQNINDGTWIKGTFWVNKTNIVEINQDDESICFTIAKTKGNYYLLDREVFGIKHNISIEKKLNISDKWFITYPKTSVIKKIDELLQDDLCIVADENGEENYLPSRAFLELIEVFPNSYEVKKYVSSRISYLLSTYVEGVWKNKESYERYLEKKEANLPLSSFPNIKLMGYEMYKKAYDELELINPLFCIAAGNDGTLESPFNRVQSPADMVNGLAVGAYTLSPLNDKYRAPYSCVGPGREGAKIKPDILEFGGYTDRPFISTKSGNLIMGTAGTSLAAPVVAGKIGCLMAASDQIVPHLGRALLIHSAESQGLEGNVENGFGFCLDGVEDILNCSDNKVTILYEGEITSSATVKLPIFAPGISEIHGNADIKWTICTVVNPNINDPDAYTNNCIEDTFYPNDMRFPFRKGTSEKKLNLLKDADIVVARELIKEGYIKSELPVSKPAKKHFAEADLRNSDFKWDTIIRKDVRMRCSSLLNPFISLHAIGRDEYEHEKIKYFVVITIDIPNFKGSLYDQILQTYDNLLPIQIQNVNRIMTQIN